MGALPTTVRSTFPSEFSQVACGHCLAPSTPFLWLSLREVAWVLDKPAKSNSEDVKRNGVVDAPFPQVIDTEPTKQLPVRSLLISSQCRADDGENVLFSLYVLNGACHPVLTNKGVDR